MTLKKIKETSVLFSTTPWYIILYNLLRKRKITVNDSKGSRVVQLGRGVKKITIKADVTLKQGESAILKVDWIGDELTIREV